MNGIRRFFKWLWNAFRRPSTRIGAGILVITGIVVGTVGSAGFLTYVEHTDTLEYCTSCHAMQNYVYPGYMESSHYSNRTGVRAICSDCHVPNAFIPKMAAKIRASMVELPSHLLRNIHDEADYLAKREELANRVWDRMRATGSRECRSCHEWDRMAAELQRTAARREHENARSEGKACIDCHMGIVHPLPASMLEVDDDDDIDWGFGGQR